MSYQALLFCPDERTAHVVTQVLSEVEFSVESCNEPFAAVKRLMAKHFDAIVVDCDNEQNATLLFKSARNSGSNQNSLSVALVEGQAGVAKAFRIGANLVLTKPINVEQSKGTLRVARGLLRKAEAARPAVAPPAALSKTSAELPHLSAPSPMQKSPLALPEEPESGFELEKEPVPEPGADDVALLESMPHTVPDASDSEQPAKQFSTPKQYPWQPISKPFAEPMASALRRAAENAGKASHDPVNLDQAEAARPAANDTKVRESWPTGSGSSAYGAASAAAPAKASSKPAASTTESRLMSPHEASEMVEAALPAETTYFPSSGDMRFGEAYLTETSESGGGKKIFLIAAVAIVLIVGGYFGWKKGHKSGQSPAVENQITRAEIAPSATASAPAAPSSTTPPNQATSSSGSEIQEPQQPAAAPEGRPSEGKPSAGKSAVATGDEVAASNEVGLTVQEVPATTPEAIVVKKGPSVLPARKSATQEVLQPPAPADLAVTENADAKALGGIMSATPVNMPTAVPQVVKVSQGVSEGLLVKRVQPVYPAQARQMRVQGPVQLQATISKDGAITNVKVMSGSPQLSRAAVDAVKQWKYKPYYLNNEPVEIQTQIIVNFKLP
ncbi:MAG TPA: TonB family protein [Terriglobales bacterium]|nr:TonB family protein [Terriglobales bacterium]